MDIILQDEKDTHSNVEGKEMVAINTTIINEKINQIVVNATQYKGRYERNIFHRL